MVVGGMARFGTASRPAIYVPPLGFASCSAACNRARTFSAIRWTSRLEAGEKVVAWVVGEMGKAEKLKS